jgi:hypothetical protein
MIQLTSLHFLLTYQCPFECDHCFVWGGPRQSGVMTLSQIRLILEQCRELGTVSSVCFEGGEPFMYYATLLKAVRLAVEMGFTVGLVSNAYWATSPEDALAALQPFSGLLSDLSLSSDLFHSDELVSRQSLNACQAAEQLGIPVGTITVARAEQTSAPEVKGQLPPGQSRVMYRGRAAVKLAPGAPLHPWEQFRECPCEDLRDPGRIHVDPFGNLHLCQGLLLGNLFREPLHQVWAAYQPEEHLLAAALLAGGPAELARRFDLAPAPGAAYADACHLCYETRLALRPRFPQLLGPTAMYGE